MFKSLNTTLLAIEYSEKWYLNLLSVFDSDFRVIVVGG